MQNKRYWLRGGIIILVLSLLTQLLTFIPQGDLNLFYALTNGIALEGLSLFYYTGYNVGYITHPVIVIITSSIIYFCIGIIFGWIYGEIKNRNKV